MFTISHQPKEKVKPPHHLRSARVSVVKQHISTPINVVHHVHQTHPSLHTTTAAGAPTAAASHSNASASFFATKSTTVIKALYDYSAKSPYELSFEKGDFFFLSNRPTIKQSQQHYHQYDAYHEAFNPITNTRGLVPKSYFQLVEKNHPATASTIPAGSSSAKHHLEQQQQTKKTYLQQQQPIYGVVLYDFQAGRSDELNAKAGEPIMIMAQSNAEWFIAKPIGRLGGPGLIPVSFVEIRRDDELNSSNGKGYNGNIKQQATPGPLPTPSLSASSTSKPSKTQQNIVVSAYIDSYILEGDQYWFIIFAKLKKGGKYRVLYRLYEDFYDFQILFLQAFPVEAGKTGSNPKRILPYMPGPLDTVNRDITADRAKDLSNYCHDLLNLPTYLSHHYLVQEQLFGLHEGDIETDIDPSIKVPTSAAAAAASAALTPSSLSSYSSASSSAATPSIPTTPTSSNSSSTSSHALHHQHRQHPQQPKISETSGSSSSSNKTMKVKIMYHDEMFAIKIPITSTLEDLKSRIVDRLKTVPKASQHTALPSMQIRCKSGQILTAEHFERAKVEEGKLTVVV